MRSPSVFFLKIDVTDQCYRCLEPYRIVLQSFDVTSGAVGLEKL